MLKHSTFIPAIFIVFLLLWALPAMAESLVDTAWVRTYDGGNNQLDSVAAIAVDDSGNVYVTGTSYKFGRDYLTIKYYPNGDTAWVRRYDGSGGNDMAYAIALDHSSNVYVTGQSQRDWPPYDYDYLTVKYYPNGDTAWVRRYNWSNDIPFAIAVDDFSNVYVTGSSGGAPALDYMTIKYYPGGDTAWVRLYDSAPGNSYDVARDIAVDRSGNVYVTGCSNDDYATIKYYFDGSTAWIKRYNGPTNSNNWANAITLDDSGNVYVTGFSGGNGTSFDYATIKYNPNGNVFWVSRYNGPCNDYDIATDLTVDHSHNVYVTGYSACDSMTRADYATIKYYRDGDTAWVRTYSGPGNYNDQATALVLDDSGNVYVTGYSWGSGTGPDYLTIKYYSNGDTAWTMRYNSNGNYPDYANTIAIDDYNNVCVTGFGGGDGGWNPDYITIKYWQNYPPNSFSLLSPFDSSFISHVVAFDWETATDPDSDDATRYDLYLSASSNFHPDSTVIYDSLSISQYTDTLDIGRYYWKVWAFDDHSSGRWSDETWTFDVFLQGDANSDGVINSADVIYLINFLFIDGPPPKPFEAGDVNCNGYITTADIVYLINYLFIGGPPPSC